VEFDPDVTTAENYPRIVIPIIAPVDSDEGAYVPITSRHNAVGGFPSLRVHRSRRSK